MKITRAFVRARLPVRSKGANKSEAGRVLIVAGAKGFRGAAALSALGALRGGAGLLLLAVPSSEERIIASKIPLEAMTAPFPSTIRGQLNRGSWGALKKSIQSFRPDVMAVGPGLGRSPFNSFFVNKILQNSHLPLVLDADGINAVKAANFSREIAAPIIMTPHEGELARFLGMSLSSVQNNRIEMALKTARIIKGICLLKGRQTIVASPSTFLVNTTGNSAMASGGMGDVLTGLIAAFWAGLHRPTLEGALQAAAVAAYIHGAAGDQLHKAVGGLSVLASDVANKIPTAIQSVR